MRESLLFVLVVGVLVAGNLLWVNRKYDLSEKNPVHEEETQKIKSILIAGQNINLEIAETPEKQKQGLSGREKLADDTGMLFIFPQSAKYGFWMKDMRFPIDMIWIAEDGTVVHIEKSAVPESFPGVFKPEKDAKYVLEVNAGFSAKHNLKVGDGVVFQY